MICLLLTILITWHPQPCDSFGVYAVHDSVTLIGTTADTCYRFDAGAVSMAALGEQNSLRDRPTAKRKLGLTVPRGVDAGMGLPGQPSRHYYHIIAYLDTRESAPSEQVSALLLDWDQDAHNTCRVKRWRSVKRQHMLRVDLPGQAESWCVYWTHETDSITAVCEFEVTGDSFVGLSDLAILRGDLRMNLSKFCRFADVYSKFGRLEYEKSI